MGIYGLILDGLAIGVKAFFAVACFGLFAIACIALMTLIMALLGLTSSEDKANDIHRN